MKKKISLLLLLIGLSFSCRKEQHEAIAPVVAPPTGTVANLSLAEVQKWYDSKSTLQTNSELKTFSLSKLGLNWSKAESFSAKKSNYWLIHLSGKPTFNNIQQGYRKIAFLKDSVGSITSRILEIIPDAQYWQRKHKVSTKDFTGYVFIYNEAYHFLGGKIYSNGKQIGISKPKTESAVNSTKLTANMVHVSEDCGWYDSSYIDSEGVFTIHSDQICSYNIYDDGFYPDMGGGGDSQLTQDPMGGGGSAGADPSTPPAVVADLPAVSNPAISPKDYMKCFGNVADAGATMKVTVYVQEPLPGTSFPYGTNGVGHTAVGLSKTGTDGTVNQVVGFYPVSASDALGGPSKLVDNGSVTAFNVSITYTVNASQFNSIVNYIANPPATYDLYNFNCTNFAIAACQTAGITLPNADTIVGLNGVGGWAHSMTPAGLGSSLDAMKGQSNVDNTGGTMPPSHKACN